VIDSVCVVVYVIRDLPLIALLFAIYTILAVVGFIQWMKKFRQQNQKLSIPD
jgi:nicotinamide riboside transporter PnuC